MKRIGLLTSGGDAPGMNAAIRSVVRNAVWHGLDVMGFEQGYEGLMDGKCVPLDARSVGAIIHRGGTILRTARSERFKTEEGRTRALHQLTACGVDGLVVIGGDGSFRGAWELRKLGVPVVGIPATIDNDVAHCDMTIGCDTALNTALEAMRRLRDTASSHDRLFIIEVMGRNCGYIALHTALSGGAECVLVPERPFDIQKLCDGLRRSRASGKSYSLVVVAEGAISGHDLKLRLAECGGYDARVTVLGYIQRGGSPSAYDAALATRLGAFAVDRLLAGSSGVMASLECGVPREVPLPQTWEDRRGLKEELMELVERLSI
ncbi:6-phosphofructokinase [Jonquetella anthropi]|uniref:6-phosphofructokinase n=1 Tax=Jonquetella anthropi TaxID=428712 RepID=UPI0001B912AA|nr:6-phosphofructokinase [Jonquetella anthropi]EEX48383.1 6-phosphofructokinase [Jonquetella anthropi E3_33 E1]